MTKHYQGTKTHKDKKPQITMTPETANRIIKTKVWRSTLALSFVRLRHPNIVPIMAVIR